MLTDNPTKEKDFVIDFNIELNNGSKVSRYVVEKTMRELRRYEGEAPV